MKNNKILHILITVIVLLLIAGGIFAYIMLNKEEPIPEGAIGNTSGNLNNHGLFCESGDYVYFSNAYDQRKLYRMKPDGTEAKCIGSVPCEYINVYGDKVFFYQTPSADDQVFGLGGLYGICSTDIKGTSGMNNIDKVICNSLVLYGPNLYYEAYIDGKLELDMADAKTEAKQKLSDKRVFVTSPYKDKFMTYNEDLGYLLSLFNPKSQEFELFDQNTRAYNIVVEGDYVYFMNIDDNYRIYRMNLSSYEKEKLTDDTVDLFNVYGSNIFYQKNSEDAPGLFHMNTDGSNAQLVKEGNFTNVNCTSTYTYFYSFNEGAPIYRVPTGGGSADTFMP